MNKIKKIFANKNMKIIIPVIVLLVLLIVVFIYWRINKYNNYRDKKELSFYQYFAGERFDYEATVSFNRHKVIKDFEVKTYNINYGSTPLYLPNLDNDMIVFPSRMSIIFPLKSQHQYKIPEFSYIEKVNNIQYLTFDDYNKNIDHYVLYDGGNLYFFSDSVTFTIGGEEIILSPLSYIIASYNELRYYDYDTDTFTISPTSEPVVVSNDYYTINVSHDTLDYSDNQLLFTNDFDYFEVLK